MPHQEEDGDASESDGEQQQQRKRKAADRNLRRDLVLGRLLGLVCAPAGEILPLPNFLPTN